MKVRALISFTGTVSMAMGDIREIADVSLAESLKKVGYVEEVKDKSMEKATETETVTEKKKSPKRKEKKDGN